MKFRPLIGTMALTFFTGAGAVMSTGQGIFKIIGIVDFSISFLFTWFVVTKYMESEFFKNLGKDGGINE